MASSDQFESGLNRWVPDDKPTRADFVNDNRILDEDAMWKATYDSDGSVQTAGGIQAAIEERIAVDNQALTITQNGGSAVAYNGKVPQTVNVTKEGIGLGNVDNVRQYSTSNKPVKADVGLGNVDNVKQVPLAGNVTMTGPLKAQWTNQSADWWVRNVLCQDVNGNNTSTFGLITRRK